MNTLAEQIIVDILTEEMQLPAKSIWIRDQNRLMPNDSGLYVIVGFIDGQVLSSETYTRADPAQSDQYFSDDALNEPYFFDDNFTEAYCTNALGGTINEVTRVQMMENIQISILSRDTQALRRHWEIVGALRSIYSQQQQEFNSFKIFRIPRSFVNASSAEGGSNINRFSITIPALVWYLKERVLSSDNGDYYDDFTTRVDDEKTIGTPHGIFAFEIKGDTINGNPPGQ